jgi:hypothetical protein
MRDGRARLFVVVAICSLVMALGWLSFAGGAFGAVGHQFVWSVSEAPMGTGLASPGFVAVNGGSGRVFVGDPGSGFVDVFDASGAFVTRFGGGMLGVVGVAVDEASGDVYVADRYAEGLDVYAPDGQGGYVFVSRWWGTGVPGNEFGEVAGVAVDNSSGPSSGDVYVLESRSAQNGPAAVDVYRPVPDPQEGEEGHEGIFLRRLTGGTLEAPNAITVSAGSGRVLVADSVTGSILAYSAEDSYEGKVTGQGSPYRSFRGKEEELGNVAGVAVDEMSGDIYVAEAERHAVSQYTPAGEWQGWVAMTPVGDLGEPRGVAVALSGGVFVADAALGVMDRFGPSVVVPSVSTEKVKKAAEGLTRTSAVLHGTINGEGKPSSYRFQYGETRALGLETPSQPASTGAQAVSARVNGLEAGHAYYYRIVGENEEGSNHGLIERFESLPAVEGLATGPVSGVGKEDATLTGSLKREGLVTHYYFQYGTSAAYGKRAPEPAAEMPPAAEEKEENKPRMLETPVSGLAPDTLYHYRLVAENEYGRTYGEDATFVTLGPPVLTLEPVTGLGQTSATLNARIDPEQSEATYRFQYGETEAYGNETTLGSAGAGSTPVAVSVALGELRVGTTYHYRLVAENTDGATTSTGATFTTISSAPVHATWTSEIDSNEAVLHAMIDPLGNDTHFYFQYGTRPCQPDPGSCVSIPLAPGTDLGDGGTDTSGEATLRGLAPDTTYYFRAIATNTLGSTEGPERMFTTQAAVSSSVLPDGREWEMVSPSDKHGAPIEALTREGGVVLTSVDGDALTYVADGALGEEVEGNRSPEMQQILATRGAKGWTTRDIATPNTKAKGIFPGTAPEYQFFSADLSRALVEPVGPGAEPALAEGVNQNTIYLRDNQTGTYLPVVSKANTPPETHFGDQIHFVSATADLNNIVIYSGVPLTGSGSASGLYEWSGGELKFVSVLPSGKPAAAPELGYSGSVFPHAVSDDGARIVWTIREENSGRGRLYLHDTEDGQTLRLDAAQAIGEPKEASAQFQAASSDGSRIFFTDRQRLTADATTEVGQAQTAGEPDLYECQIVEVAAKLACNLIDLTVDYNEGQHADVQNLIFGASEDGTRIYLVAQGVLATNANGNNEQAVAGKDNLYEIHYDGAQWTRTYIATLSEGDGPEWGGGTTKSNSAYVTARVSSNGRYLAFMSQAPITGYDNIDANPAANGARDQEVYLYDSLTTTLRCVSCSPSGARPAGVLDTERAGEGLGLLVDRRLVWGREGHEHWLAGNIPGWTAQTLTNAVFQPRYLTDQGRLYFNSPDALVPAAKNGKENVYEYEPSGVGSCQSLTGGCVSLLSGGSSDREAAFLEATPDGSSVFFLTEGRLIPQQDTDTAFDIYVARECSEASPCLSPPPTKGTACEETEDCRPAQPARQVPGGPYVTSSYSPEGNILTDAPPSRAKQETRGKKAIKKLTRSQKRIRALKRCRKHHAHSNRKRIACEHAVGKRYAKHHPRRNGSKKRKRKATQHNARLGGTHGKGGGR